MSAGFKLDGVVYWGTNGAVEAYLEAMEPAARRLFGADDPLVEFLREQREEFFMGQVVFLDQHLEAPGGASRLLRLFDAATADLLESGTFTEYGRTWVTTVVVDLRAKLVQRM
jgi:hypothetical protein